MDVREHFNSYLEIIHPTKSRDFIRRELKKDEELKKELKKRSLQDSLFNVIFAAAIAFIFSMLATPLIIPADQLNLTGQTEGISAFVKLVSSPAFITLRFLFGIPLFYAFQYVLYLMLKVIGGNPEYPSQVYLVSILRIPAIIFPILIALTVNVIPQIGILFDLIRFLSIVIGIYIIFLFYSVIKESNASLSWYLTLIVMIVYLALELLLEPIISILVIGLFLSIFM